jgi:hypothetical protein
MFALDFTGGLIKPLRITGRLFIVARATIKLAETTFPSNQRFVALRAEIFAHHNLSAREFKSSCRIVDNYCYPMAIPYLVS